MKIFYLTLLALAVTGCIHPKVGLRKARLLDPMMDPSRPAEFSDTALASASGSFERGVTSGGGRTGGSCPTCK